MFEKTESPVMITKSEKSGQVVTPYKRKKLFGYVQLTQTEESFGRGWLREEKKSTLLRGDVKSLARMVKKYDDGKLPGRLHLHEHLNSEVTEAMKIEYMGKDYKVDFNKKAEQFMKRAGKTGPFLTKDGEPIWRFVDYDPIGESTDVTIQHDNVEAVRAHRLAEQEAREKQELAAGAGVASQAGALPASTFESEPTPSMIQQPAVQAPVDPYAHLTPEQRAAVEAALAGTSPAPVLEPAATGEGANFGG